MEESKLEMFLLQQQTSQYQTKQVARSTNNSTGRIFRNARVINIKPTAINKCGSFTKDPTKANIPEKVISCCPSTSSSNLTWQGIVNLSANEIDSYIGKELPSCDFYVNMRLEIVDTLQKPLNLSRKMRNLVHFSPITYKDRLKPCKDYIQ